jgi:DNA-binding SARP family transcriptional activator
MIEIAPEQIAGLDPDDNAEPLWRDGSAEAQPIIVVEDPELALVARERARGNTALIGALPDADRVLFFEGGRVSIEPLGLNLRACLPEPSELEAATRLAANASADPEPLIEDLGGLPPPMTDLPAPGVIEVRLLRGVPDLVGDVAENIPRPALQFIAYLAAHGGHSTTSRLRDALGAYKMEDSRASQTIWNAAVLARKAIGPERVPRAVNKEQYTLSSEVTCDWLRFEQMGKIARAAELVGEHERAVEVLTRALELVEGAPGAETNYFSWLDREQFSFEIERAVVEVAHRLFGLALAERSFDVAQWSIDQGRLVSPDDGELRRDAMTLAHARGDTIRVASEYAAAGEAVNALEMGADIDELTDATYARFARARAASEPPSTSRRP